MRITQPLEMQDADGQGTGRYRLVEMSDEHDGAEPLCECGGRSKDSPATAGHATMEEARACPIAQSKLSPSPRGKEMSFGEAIELARHGARVARKGWNGKGMWVRYVDLYNDREFKLREEPGAVGTWLPFLAMKTVDNGLVPWLASQTDILAHDWVEAL